MTNDKAYPGDFRGGGEVVINGDRFRADSLIHQSADSRIYSATSSEGGADPAFVIKCYCCEKDGEIWRQAMREIEAGRMLRRRKHIMRLLGYSVAAQGGGLHGIFLLFDRLPCVSDMTVSQAEVLEICRDISLALEEMRREGLVHGDVKPSNLFRGSGGWLLGDLGSVRLPGEAPRFCSEGYCAPEVLRGEPCDIRSDIYSLGITAYCLLSGGRLPFCAIPCGDADEEDVYRAIGRRLDGEFFPPPEGVSPEFARILERMWRYDPKTRPNRPLKLARELDRLIQSKS